MNRQEVYPLVRLPRDVKDELEAFLAEEIGRARAKPTAYNEPLRKGRVGLGDAVKLLLDYFNQERNRKASYARKKKEDRKLDEKLIADMVAEGSPVYPGTNGK